MTTEKEIELRSEQVQEILTKTPSWMIRWGNMVILLIIVLVFFFSWLIKYPDIVTAEISITTEIPPEKLVARATGRIEEILVEDRANVSAGTPLAIIESAADYRDVFQLKAITDTINIRGLQFIFPFEKLPVMKLGAIENSFAQFEKDYLAYQLNSELKPYKIDVTAQNDESTQLQERYKLLQEQYKLGEKELEFKRRELDRNKKLYEKGVISTQELEMKSMEYLQQEKNLNTLASQLSLVRSSINNLSRDKKATHISQAKDDMSLLKNVVLSFNHLRQSIAEWEITYVLRSSIAGKVSFMQIWSENQTISTGENAFVIIPQEKSVYVGKIKAPAENSGKIKIGQEVNIRLLNYPDVEFGVIRGKVKLIALTPDKENNVLIDVELPQGIETSYHKEIDFRQEMRGTADIITEDLRFIERLLHQFRDVFKR